MVDDVRKEVRWATSNRWNEWHPNTPWTARKTDLTKPLAAPPDYPTQRVDPDVFEQQDES
jgi:hypothetical protein